MDIMAIPKAQIIATFKLDAYLKNPSKYIKKVKTNDLADMIKKSSYAYHTKGKPLMSDRLYDMLEEELRARKPNHPVLKKVGAPLRKGKVKLPYAMPSLDKIKPGDDVVEAWADNYEGPYVLTDKLDGVSLLLVGRDGYWEVYTRGDGTHGGDLTRFSSTLNLPKSRPGVVVRAEAIMPASKFKSLYSKEAENPRNFTSGILNPNRIAPHKGVKHVKIIAYELIKPVAKPSAQLKKLKAMGFKIVPYKVVPTIDSSVLADYYQFRRKAAKFDIDGIVVTQDAPHKRTPYNPPYSKAFKMLLAEQTAKVTVKRVEWNLSKHGYYKPRIEIKPVRLGGVTIRYLTGFNAYFIQNGKLSHQEDKPTRPIGPGAVLKIVRSGDVIPHILKVIKGSKKPQMPDGRYEWTDSGIDIYQVGKKNIKDVEIKKLTHFFRTIAVDGMDIGTVTRLYEDGLTTIPDILKASTKRLLRIPGIQDKTAKKIVSNIETSLDGVDMGVLMDASGCFGRLLGGTRLGQVASKYPRIAQMPSKKAIRLVSKLPGFSGSTIEAFEEGLPKFKKFYREVEPYVRVSRKKVKKVSDMLSGQSVAFTGFRDKALEKKIVENGGKVSSGVSSTTTILLMKDPSSSSSKAQRAKSLGIKLMTPEQFTNKYGL